MTTPTATRSFTIQDQPALKLAVALDGDVPVALAIEVEDCWLVRRTRRDRPLDYYFDDREQALRVLTELAAMS